MARSTTVSRMATSPFSRIKYPQMGAVAVWSQTTYTRRGERVLGEGAFSMSILYAKVGKVVTKSNKITLEYDLWVIWKNHINFYTLATNRNYSAVIARSERFDCAQRRLRERRL